MKVKAPAILSVWLAATALACGQADTQAPPAALFDPNGSLPAGLRLGTGLEPAQRSSWFVSADNLLWWIKPSEVPIPLLTTTLKPQDLSRGDPSLSNPNIAVLFGNQSIDYPIFEGGRIRGGLAPTDSGDPGFEGTVLFLPIRGSQFLFQTGAGGAPALILPFENIGKTPPAQAGAPLTGILSGRVVPGSALISSDTQLWSGEVSATLRVVREDSVHLDLLTGVRSVGMTDMLTIMTNSINGAQSAGTFDQFATRNYFFGGQVGGRLGWQGDRFSAQVSAQLALGASDEIVTTQGFTDRPASIVKLRAGPREVPGGFFSDSSLGVSRNTRFAVVSEVGLDLGWRVTDRVQLKGGYNFLYWSSVMRAADQVNRNLNQSQLPLFGGDFNNPPTGLFPRRQSDLWADGFSVGLEIVF